MDTNALAAELFSTRLIVLCEHDAWAEVTPSMQTYECAAGVRHDVFTCIAAGSAWAATIQAWNDLHETQHPASLAEFRRCQRELTSADVRVRQEIERIARQPRGFVQGFMAGLTGRN